MKTVKITVMLLGVILMSSFIFPGADETSNVTRNQKEKNVQFRIQLCSYYEAVPVKEVELMREIGGVSSMKIDGKSTYVTAPFSSEAEAQKELPKFQSLGFYSAEKVVTMKDDLLSMEDYYSKFDITPEEDDTEAPVIRLWK